MIEIVKHRPNQEPEYHKYRITCNYCGCVFTCETSDWRHNIVTGYGERDDILWCPECGKRIYLSCIYSLNEGVKLC